MESVFSWRKTRVADLPECLKVQPAQSGAEQIGPSRALEAWQSLLQMDHAIRSIVIERISNGTPEIVAFGMAAFVKRDFADREVESPRPGLNSRIIASVGDGNRVIASYEEVREANTRGDLQQVILQTMWKDSSLNAAQRDEVRMMRGLAFGELYSGYCFSRVLRELVDELDFWDIEGYPGFHILDRFEAFRLANPETSWNPKRALAAVTVESIRAHPGSAVAALFHRFSEPRLGLTRSEQELLEVALDGMDDRTASKALFVSLPAIKRRWQSIFDHVSSVSPELCPSDGNGTRGTQKRQRILTYLRNHREELRPFDFRKRPSTAQ